MKKLLLLLLAGVLLASAMMLAAYAEETFINPVANGADPFVFKDKDGAYYLYATSGGSYGYRVYTSTNLVEWEAKGYCLRRGDVYVDPEIGTRTYNESKGEYTVSTYYNFWAPEVFEHNGVYYMAYTAQEHLGIATSDSPLGPFTNDADSYLFPHENTGYADGETGATVSTMKCIDGHFYKDDDGTVYLYFVSCGPFSMNGDSIDHGNNIWGGPFDLETLTFAAGYPKKLVEHDNKNEVKYDGWVNTSTLSFLRPNYYDGSAVAEGPEMLKYNGKYYLTFSQDGYTSTQYSVFYVTSDSPLGPWSAKKLAFITADQEQKDTNNPHLYGVGHHCFTTSPDDSELIIVYHAHRNNGDPNGTGSSVEERRVCLDLAGFDESGNFFAGRKQKGFPTATAQVLPSGGKLSENTTHFDGAFAEIPNLPTVYLSAKDGNDENDGSSVSKAFRTFEAAYAALPNGGTIILTQTYQCPNTAAYTLPASNGPIQIKGMHSALFLAFKTLRLSSDTYFDNLTLLPQTTSDISSIDCGWNNVTIGESVGCMGRPVDNSFPVLIGGRWWRPASGAYYVDLQYENNAALTTDKEFEIKVYSGTWDLLTKDSVKSTGETNNTVLANTSVGGTLFIGDGALLMPTKATSAPTVVISSKGAKISAEALDAFAVFKNGRYIGHSEDGTFVDASYVSGEEASYAVANYVHGALIGAKSGAVEFDWTADLNGDGNVTVVDALEMLKGILNGSRTASLLDVLVVLRFAMK